MGAFGRYLEQSFFDFLLLAVLCASASGLMASGFWSGDALTSSPPALVAIAAVTLALLYAFSYSKRTVVAGVVVIPVLAVAAVAVAASTWSGGDAFGDVAGNPALPLLVAIVTTVVVYLLTRRRAGIVVLLFLGVLVSGYLQFIYKENHVVYVAVFFLCCLIALAYRNVSRSRDEAGQQRGHGALAFGLCCLSCAVIVGAGVGAYAATIARIDPPTMQVKLLKEYLRLPEVSMRGIADYTSIEDQRKQTSKSDDTQTESSGEGGKNQDEGDRGSGAQETPADTASREAYNQNAQDSGYAPTWYQNLAHVLLWPLLIIAAVVAAVLAKLWSRRRWAGKARALPRGEQVRELYRFYLERLRRMRIVRMAPQTPREFLEANEPYLGAFKAVDGTDFSFVTDLFARVSYGNAPVGDEDLRCLWGFHDVFYENCRQHLGRFKYLLRFFRL